MQKADAYLRNGRYSPALMKADVDSILALYRANGFDKAAISTAVKDMDTSKSGKKLKVAEHCGGGDGRRRGRSRSSARWRWTGVDEQPG